jgi:hypothetical protein
VTALGQITCGLSTHRPKLRSGARGVFGATAISWAVFDAAILIYITWLVSVWHLTGYLMCVVEENLKVGTAKYYVNAASLV